jgi:hypothetical protein
MGLYLTFSSSFAAAADSKLGRGACMNHVHVFVIRAPPPPSAFIFIQSESTIIQGHLVKGEEPDTFFGLLWSEMYN